MKSNRIFSTIFFGLLLSSQFTLAQNRLMLQYDGRTPCHELAAQLKQAIMPECTKIKWRLILYSENKGSQNGNYTLEGFVFRKEKMLKGNWKIIKGTATD